MDHENILLGEKKFCHLCKKKSLIAVILQREYLFELIEIFPSIPIKSSEAIFCPSCNLVYLPPGMVMENAFIIGSGSLVVFNE